ncbi:MAG TPA: hypothetical protein VGB76_11915 [Pyrinomonadaceae bacterium]|jgi:hypothetical protein
MHEERDEPGETFNQDQQEMFQNPDTSPGETRPPTPGALNPLPLTTDQEDDDSAKEP